MSTIRCIYSAEPNFPATDQHPTAVRYRVGQLIVDAIGGLPTQAEIDAALGNDAAGLAAKQRLVTDDAELVTAKADATLMSLINMDAAQIAAAIDNAFPDPAQRVILKRICRVLIPTARRVFR